MRGKNKLSVLITIMLLLQLVLPVNAIQQQAAAATSGPVVKTLSPSDNTTNVPIRANFSVTFDEEIVKYDNNKKITIHRYSDNSVIQSFAMNSSYVTVSGNTLTLQASHITLDTNTEYYILIEAGAVANASNAALFAGINSPSAWNFKTIAKSDDVRPTVSSTSPSLCSTSGTCDKSLPITTSLTFNFSEPVYVDSGSISLTSSVDNRSIPVTSSEIVGSGTRKITITPNTVLKPATLYTLTISGSNIVDASGNNYLGGSWRFNTSESPVKLIQQAPVNGATGVGLSNNLILNFDKKVQASSSKKIQIRKVANNELVFDEYANSSRISINGSSVTINPGSLSSNTSYYVTIEPGAFYASGKPKDIYYGMSNATDWKFQTGYGNDTIPPTISTYSPQLNSTAVGAAERIILTFSEPVFANSGKIEIREYNSDALYRSIDLTSSRITGGGTTQITIDPHSAVSGERAKSFTVGSRYYVSIGNQAFVDGAGNAFAGISNKGYSFHVSSQEAGPQLVALSPVNLSTTVATDATFKFTFDKPVLVDSSNNKAMIYSLTDEAIHVAATLKVSSSDNKVVELIPAATLEADNDYYINIEANSIYDSNGNYFIGIKNQYQWKFKTLGGDTTPPDIVKAEVSGNVIRLVYNELLNEKQVPSPAQFYVTVAGNARNVNSVKIEGNVVFVTLSSTVSSSQQVLISYSRSNSNQIQDLTGNYAPDFANQVATNGFTETNPVVTSSSFNGSTITLTFSENLETIHSLAFTQFSVTVNGVATTISRISQSNNSLVFTLGNSIASGSAVVVHYVEGLYPITGLSSNKVVSFSHTVGTTTGGGGGGNVPGAPVMQSISLSGDKLYIRYNKSMSSSSTPGTYQYAVLVNGRAASVRSVVLSGDTVVLTLSSSPSSNDTVYVTYYGTGSTLLDSDYNAAASFNNMLATSSTNPGNGSNSTAVSVQGAIIKGDTLTLNFSGNLDASSVPDASNFLVRISDNVRVISSISIVGSQVILKLNTATKVGETATVSYFNTTGTLRSSSGTAVNGFTNLAVANQTTVLDVLTDDYTSAINGLLIKTSASSTSSDVSPGGYSATRYTLVTEKLITAISTLADANMTKAQIIFEVPASERAAIVALSVSALEYAERKGDFTIVVKHGNRTYELPVASINVTAAARALGGNSVSNYLKLVLEEGETPATSSLVTAINRSGATMLEGPFYYDAVIVNGANSEPAKITGNLTRTIQTNRSFTNNNTAAVFYDEVVGQLSYVPTTFNKSGSATTVVFKRPGNSAYALVSSNKLFSDSSNHWGLSSISVMTRKFIADGHSSTNFNPKTNITRGEFATYIVRGLGLSANKEAARQFKDVNSNSVMGGYIGAAVESGIVSGVSSTSFAPNNYITRQDMALMMIRAANYVGIDTKLVSTADTVLSGYKDKSSVSSYAKTGLAQAIEIGIISGTSSTTLSPKDNAERVQGIIMIQRLLEKAGYLQK